MSGRRYVIVGAGMTAHAAAYGIRETDPSGAIAIVGEEPHRPYERPPLSKGLWKGSSVNSIFKGGLEPGVSLHLAVEAVAIDRPGKEVSAADGTRYPYDKLLLATGGAPRRLPSGNGHVLYYRSLDDYLQLRDLSARRTRFTVIGGGFVGSEIASTLATSGRKVTMIFPEKSLGARAFPGTLGIFLNAYYRDRGVNLLCGSTVSAIEADGARLRVRTTAGNEVAADAIVAGVGIEPRVELARAAGLRLENGIAVDAQLRTSDPDIYAAGDVASFYCPALERRVRVEHEDNANAMGRLAGRNMAGRAEAYDHLPFFCSDLFDLGYEAVGILDSSLDMVEDWKQQFRKGVVYYLEDDRVRGVLLWNTRGRVNAARQLIASRERQTAASLAGRITDEPR